MGKLMGALVAMALIVGFGVKAMAAQGILNNEEEIFATAHTKEILIYGSVRMSTWWQHLSKEVVNPAAPRFSDSDLNWALDAGGSRFGALFKSGPIGAVIGIRPVDSAAPVLTRFVAKGRAAGFFRYWAGFVDLGWAVLEMGYQATPSFNPVCNESLVGGGGMLDVYGDTGFTGKRAGLQLAVPIKTMNALFRFGLIEPYVDPGTTGTNGPQLTFPTLAGHNETDFTIPKVEAAFTGAFGPLVYTVRGGYNTVDIRDTLTNDKFSVDSYFGALDATYSLGPFYLRGTGYRGRNQSVYGCAVPDVFLGLFPQAFVGTSLEDVDNYGWFGVVGFRFSDRISVEAGYGQRHSQQDYPEIGATAGGAIKENTSAFVVFSPISIARRFVITPEILWLDRGSVKGAPAGGIGAAGTPVTNIADRGNMLFVGVHWRIDF